MAVQIKPQIHDTLRRSFDAATNDIAFDGCRSADRKRLWTVIHERNNQAHMVFLEYIFQMLPWKSDDWIGYKTYREGEGIFEICPTVEAFEKIPENPTIVKAASKIFVSLDTLGNAFLKLCKTSVDDNCAIRFLSSDAKDFNSWFNDAQFAACDKGFIGNFKMENILDYVLQFAVFQKIVHVWEGDVF